MTPMIVSAAAAVTAAFVMPRAFLQLSPRNHRPTRIMTVTGRRFCGTRGTGPIWRERSHPGTAKRMTNAAEPPCTLSTFRNLLRALVPREVLWRAEWGLPRSPVDRFVNAEYRRSNWFCREFETRPLIPIGRFRCRRTLCSVATELRTSSRRTARMSSNCTLRLIQIRRVK